MGTNYYYKTMEEACKECGHFQREILHLGKSSVGWRFVFKAHGSIVSFDDWKNVFYSTPGYIENEYENAVSLKDFIELVGSKQNGKIEIDGGSSYLDEKGYWFQDYEFS